MTKKVQVIKTERPELPAYIDYKDTEILRGYLTVIGKIVPRYFSGISLKQQKRLSLAIKRSREMGMLPYTSKF